MMTFKDYLGRNIRLTDNRLEHILTRSEMAKQEEKIRETLLTPDKIKKSKYRSRVLLYYKLYEKTPVTKKYLLVAVKVEKWRRVYPYLIFYRQGKGR
ncbi:MAG: hypothetical protein AB1478_05250 [Nitrospirota bacterium]